jgi:outer membrane protein TolC
MTARQSKNLQILWIVSGSVLILFGGFIPSVWSENQGTTPPSLSEPALMDISVKDAILFALENNPSLKAQRYVPSLKETYVQEEKGAFDPALSGGVTIKDDETGSGNLSLSWPLPTGTRPSVSFSGEKRTPTSSNPYSDAVTYSLGITQSLLQGGPNRTANLAKVQAAQLDLFASQWELRAFAETLVFNVEKAYWDHYLALRQAEIYRNSLALAEQQLEDTRKKIAVGRIAELELAAAQVEVAQRKEVLISAEGRIETTRLRLLQYIVGGRFRDLPVNLRGEPRLLEEETGDVQSRVEIGLQKRPDLVAARFSRDKGDLEVVRTKNGLLPKLDFFIFLGSTVYRDSLGDAGRNLFSDDPTLSAGISLSIPLGNRAADARARRAVVSRAQMEEALNNMERVVEVEIRTAFTEAKRTRASITATAETRRLQAEKLQAELEKYQVGRSTSFLVATAERDLLSATLEEAQAVVNHILAVLTLYKAEGTLLDRRGITFSIDAGAG